MLFSAFAIFSRFSLTFAKNSHLKQGHHVRCNILMMWRVTGEEKERKKVEEEGDRGARDQDSEQDIEDDDDDGDGHCDRCAFYPVCTRLRMQLNQGQRHPRPMPPPLGGAPLSLPLCYAELCAAFICIRCSADGGMAAESWCGCWCWCGFLAKSL